MLDVGQVPLNIGSYIAGFVDGEGSFNVSFRPRLDYKFPWKVSLCFNISQRDPLVLQLCQRSLQCGTMRQRADGVWYFEVNTLDAIIENVIPFFKKFSFLSSKKNRDFEIFCQMTEVFIKGEHLTGNGIRAILSLREKMNDGGKRKYSAEQILKVLESSETKRQTLEREMI